MTYSRQFLLDLYTGMERIRRFEEEAIVLWDTGLIKGSIHPYLGQEAIATGVCMALEKDDYIASTHRGHGHCLAKGTDPGAMFAELLGKQTGCCRGRGGSMHIADFSTRNLGANGLVGAGLGIGAGAALAAKLRKESYIVAAFFGEGSTGEGMFHEAVNMAAVWKLPILFICENNRYAVSTDCNWSVPVPDVSMRATAYGIPGVTIDGNDVLAVYETAQKYVELARSGAGPALIECKTYRWEGHYHGEPQVYRTKAEVEQWKALCPILAFEKVLEQQGIEKGDLDAIRAAIALQMQVAIQYAKESPDPSPDSVLDFLYAD